MVQDEVWRTPREMGKGREGWRLEEGAGRKECEKSDTQKRKWPTAREMSVMRRAERETG